MHTQTMEGLVGARTNMDLLNTPMRVYREARRRGDTAVMERAMGYAGDFAGKADEYQKKAEEGMKKDAQEEKERLKQMQEEALRKRREERRELEESLEKASEKRGMSGQEKTKTEEDGASGFAPDYMQDSKDASDAAAQAAAVCVDVYV